MSEEQEQRTLEPLGPSENCGGPLICKNCAMKLAQKYYDHGLLDWAELYQRQALLLNNQEQIKTLTQQNQQLLMEKSQLEQQIWKDYV